MNRKERLRVFLLLSFINITHTFTIMSENIKVESVSYEVDANAIVIQYNGKIVSFSIDTLLNKNSIEEKENIYKKFYSGEIYYYDDIQYGATFASNDVSKNIVVVCEDSNLEFDKYIRVIDSNGYIKQCEVRNLSRFDAEEVYTYPYSVEKQYSSPAKITGSWCVVERSTNRLVAAYYFDNEKQSTDAAAMCYEAVIYLTEQFNGN